MKLCNTLGLQALLYVALQIGPLNQETKKNNRSSRDEISQKNSRIYLERLLNKYKRIKHIPSFGQNTGIQKKLVATYKQNSGFGGLEVACWSLVPKFEGSNPAETVGFFRAKKILRTPSFGREVKPFVPCRRYIACKRSLNVTWKSGIFRQNSSAISRPSSSSFHY